MVQTNKILTVSYGTFSCTLEGFEDSFDTMKAIAEYFRDLAADDRYFGAEPPQPDADMLARIAQKEISRQVEAHRDGNEFLLRAAAPALESAASRKPAEPAARPDIAAAPEPEPAAEPEPDLAPWPDMTDATVPEPPAAEAEAAGGAAVEILEPVSAPATPSPATESMADKLARIRAVVERSDSIADDQIEDVEDAIVDPPETGATVVEEDAPTAETLAPEVVYEDEEPYEDDEAEDVLHAPASADISAAFDVPEASEEPAEVPDEDAAAEHDAPAPAGSEDLIGSVLAATTATDRAQAEDEDDSLFGDLSEEDDGEIEDADNILAEDEPAAARALKVKRADLEDALATGDLEEIHDEVAEDAGSSLPPEEEADLQAELDAVAAELAEAQAALNPPDEDGDELPAAEHRREGRGDAIKGSAPPVTRLLAEAEGKMDDPESAMSREAYDHLRAAVVATRAEERAEGDGGKPKALTDSEYREDLASVVKPRRPDAGSAPPRSRRPEESRPAPLKLVAEQRIDADSVLPQRGPIRPRRIEAEAEAEDEQTKPGGFAAFANEVGATELPELLEAAAAYMSFVEGWDQFSRPQLMTRVKQVENCGFNREDGLRTFGQLLREGKIEKTSGGRFTASERIGFRPARKAAG